MWTSIRCGIRPCPIGALFLTDDEKFLHNFVIILVDEETTNESPAYHGEQRSELCSDRHL